MYGGASIISSTLVNAVAVDYHWDEQMIYWSDVTNLGSNITRMHFNGDGHEVGDTTRPNAGRTTALGNSFRITYVFRKKNHESLFTMFVSMVNITISR